MSNEKKSPSFFARLGHALMQIFRFVFVLAIVAVLGAAIYFGVPYIYEKVILPIETNTARLEEVEQQQVEGLALVGEDFAAMQNRLNELENRQTETAQDLAEMQGQVEALEKAIDAHGETLKSLETIETSLDTLFATTEAHESLLVGDDSALSALERQVSLSRAIELLSRAQLYLSQSNYGLAKADIENAKEILLAVETEIPEERVEALREVIQKLDLATRNLPDTPTIAADSLDIAWQMLVNDLPDLPDVELLEDAEVTPTPEMEPESTETP